MELREPLVQFLVKLKFEICYIGILFFAFEFEAEREGKKGRPKICGRDRLGDI